MLPTLSVCLAAQDEPDLYATVDAFYRAAERPNDLEFSVVDDASAEPVTLSRFGRDVRSQVKLTRFAAPSGGARSRNRACAEATGDLLFISDAHVRVSPGWDSAVRRLAHDDYLLTFTVRSLVGGKADLYGSSLIYPSFGTLWNRHSSFKDNLCHVACFPATALTRQTFWDLGGLDESFMAYGAIEPEFSLRAWLFGRIIVHSSALTVWHRFKEDAHRVQFLKSVDFALHYNYARLAFLYGDPVHQLKMLGHWRQKSHERFNCILSRLNFAEITARKRWLDANTVISFEEVMAGFGFER